MGQDIESKIYKIIDIPVQETMLGKYTIIHSDENEYGTELKSILETIDLQKVVD